MTTEPTPYDTDRGLGPNDPPHQYLHAVGRFALACGALEFWLGYAVVELHFMTEAEAAKNGSIGEYLKLMRRLPKRLPPPERESLRAALVSAGTANELRHAVIHGLTSSVTAEIGESWRPDKKKRTPGGLPQGRLVPIERLQLHEGARRCHHLIGLIQAYLDDWREALGIDSEEL